MEVVQHEDELVVGGEYLHLCNEAVSEPRLKDVVGHVAVELLAENGVLERSVFQKLDGVLRAPPSRGLQGARHALLVRDDEERSHALDTCIPTSHLSD